MKPTCNCEAVNCPALLDTKAVAAIGGCHPKSVLRLVHSGQLPKPVISTRKMHRWRPADIEAHFARRKMLLG